MKKLSLRIADDLHTALVNLARAQSRSLNSQILQVLKAALAQRKPTMNDQTPIPSITKVTLPETVDGFMMGESPATAYTIKVYVNTSNPDDVCFTDYVPLLDPNNPPSQIRCDDGRIYNLRRFMLAHEPATREDLLHGIRAGIHQAIQDDLWEP